MAGIGGEEGRQLQQMIDTAVAKALLPVTDDIEMLEDSISSKMKSLNNRIKRAELRSGEVTATVGASEATGDQNKPSQKEADERDEM